MEMNQSRVIVITGVSHGLGRAMVEEFQARGHTVFGCARTPSAIAELNRKFGERFEVVDVLDDSAVAQWAARVGEAGGVPDLLLNNAAVINRNARLWEVPAADFDRVIDVNLKGVANVIRHFVPRMVARRVGVIVNFSSGWGRSTDAEVAPYC